jgi:hypothetical protein
MAAGLAPSAAAAGSGTEAAAATSKGAAAGTEADVEVAAGNAPAASAAGACSWSSCTVAHDCRQQVWLSPAEAGMVQRFDPAGQADTIGFFVAKFVKTCSIL